jgi:tetratricopeptide (TPR) repeat protein
MSSDRRNKSGSRGTVTAADLALKAESAYRAGDLEGTIHSWEGAHALALDAGDTLAAANAAVHVALHLLMDTGFMAPVRGWTRRARRLLEGREEGPVHAWLAVVEAYERFLSGDYAAACEEARHAIAIGSSTSEPAAVAVGRVGEARSRIFLGDVAEGTTLLDEAGAALLSGELDALSAGIVYCELVCAYQGLALYDRAEEWTAAMERWSASDAVGSFSGRCRVHRAEILRLRGATAEAEDEILRACDELRPYLRLEFGWPLTELGRIRLRRGDPVGAREALTAAREVGWDVEPWASLLELASGRSQEAAASIREALGRPTGAPSKELPPNSELRRAPLLDAAAEIFVATGDIDAAAQASVELSKISGRFGSTPLAAAAAIARGRVAAARGDVNGAREAFAEGIRLWSEVGAPDERALAMALMASINSVESPPTPSAPSATGVFRRNGDYWMIGLTSHTIHVKNVRGLSHVARLLGVPGRELHVLELAGASSVGDAGILLDEKAKEMYRRRLADIEDDIATASEFGDSERAARAAVERDYLVRELASAVGLGGRDRRAGAASERARASVTRAIRLAIARVRSLDAAVGEHLDRTIRTGTYCAYMPDPRAPIAWDL